MSLASLAGQGKKGFEYLLFPNTQNRFRWSRSPLYFGRQLALCGK